MTQPTPQEILKSLYTQEVIQPDYYMDIDEMPEPGGEPGEIKISGKLPIGVGQGSAAQVCKTPVIAPKCNTKLHEILRPNGKINHVPNMFLAMAQEAAEKELPYSTLVISLYNDDTNGVLPDQYVSQLWLVIHRMPADKKMHENIPVPGYNREG